MVCLSNPSLGLESVVFFGSSCNGGASSQHERMFRSRLMSVHALNDPDSNLEAGIFLMSTAASGNAEVIVVADTRTQVPGKGATKFSAFSNPVAGDTSVVFVGLTTTGSLGVYSYSLKTHAIELVVDDNTPIPTAVLHTAATAPVEGALDRADDESKSSSVVFSDFPCAALNQRASSQVPGLDAQMATPPPAGTARRSLAALSSSMPRRVAPPAACTLPWRGSCSRWSRWLIPLPATPSPSSVSGRTRPMASLRRSTLSPRRLTAFTLLRSEVMYCRDGIYTAAI